MNTDMSREEKITHTELFQSLDDQPIITAIKNPQGLKNCISCEGKVVFVLYGTINNIPNIIETLKDAGKIVFVHIDLIEGLSPREAAVDYLWQNTKADGIISTKPTLIRSAKACGFLTVQRFFVLDSLALESIRKTDTPDSADLIEILPGLMPKIISMLTHELNKPIIAGGLISTKEDVITALGAGATAISSTNQDIWFM